MDTWVQLIGAITALILAVGGLMFKFGVGNGKRQQEDTENNRCVKHSEEIVRTRTELESLRFSLDELRGRHERLDESLDKRLEEMSRQLNQLIGRLERGHND